MNVEILRTETIKPSISTPQHLKTLKLSLIDHMIPPIYTSMILFYPKPNITTPSTNSRQNISQTLKNSLSETLALFYPFAGKINSDATAVDCNDDGVPFVEAESCSSLTAAFEIGFSDEAAMQSLLPEAANSPESTTPPLRIQATFFSGCSGFALGVCLSHRLADAATLALFLKTWAAKASGAAHVATPDFESGAAVFSQENNEGAQNPLWQDVLMRIMSQRGNNKSVSDSESSTAEFLLRQNTTTQVLPQQEKNNNSAPDLESGAAEFSLRHDMDQHVMSQSRNTNDALDCKSTATEFPLRQNVSAHVVLPQPWKNLFLLRQDEDQRVRPQLGNNNVTPNFNSSHAEFSSSHENKNRAEQVTRRFVIDKASMATLKARAGQEFSAARSPSRVEATTALVWKCAAAACGDKPQSMLLQNVNLRTRTEPPIPAEATGNLAGTFLMTADRGSETGVLVGKMRRGIEEFVEKRVRKLRVDRSTVEEYLEMWFRNIRDVLLRKMDEVSFFACTSWCNMGFYEIDFGVIIGKPVYVAGVGGSHNINLIILMDTKDGQGVEACLTLTKADMISFESDSDLTQFASPGRVLDFD